MEWSPKQERALRDVARWMERRDQPVFRLFGYAGTGKTTLARHFAQGVEGHVAFAAYTGKAALVMRRAGCPQASTIHSLIYCPKDKSRAGLWQLEQERDAAREAGDDSLVAELEAKIKIEKKNLNQPSFVLNPESDLQHASLLVIDECSMVGEDMANDVLLFGVPVLVLGDPAQLPPVRGSGYFTDARPDAMLTEIHRQARDNPIVEMATRVRTGKKLEVGRYGSSEVLPASAFDREAVSRETQVLVGKNATRHRANEQLRKNRFDGRLPDDEVVEGDRLVCLRNDYDVGILNGQLFDVEEVVEITDHDTVRMRVVDEAGGSTKDVEAHRSIFRQEEIDDYWTLRSAHEFDYGYALTCHKAQGSQWDSVVVVDESGVFRQNAKRWLYTAITRAAETVQVVR